jgi:hypothetical protein
MRRVRGAVFSLIQDEPSRRIVPQHQIPVTKDGIRDRVESSLPPWEDAGISTERETVTHEEALRLIDERIGERVQLNLFLPSADGDAWGATDGRVMFLARAGRLFNPLEPKPPRLESGVGYYGFRPGGADAYPLHPVAETIELRDSGLDFHLPGGALIRVAWRGSSEVGEGPDPGRLARLRLMGAASEEESRQDDASIELRRFLREAPRAPAEVLSAGPTEHRNKDDGRRIWELRLRVRPPEGAPFEAGAEVIWPANGEIDGRLGRGELLTCVPTSRDEIEVAYDPERREEVMAYPDSTSEPAPIALRIAIVGEEIA